MHRAAKEVSCRMIPVATIVRIRGRRDLHGSSGGSTPGIVAPPPA
jgi:hypothetical protein